MRYRRSGLYRVQEVIVALHARGARPEDPDWAEIDALFGIGIDDAVASRHLSRAVTFAKLRGPEVVLNLIEALAPPLSSYFHFFGVKGVLLMQLGRSEEALSI